MIYLELPAYSVLGTKSWRRCRGCPNSYGGADHGVGWDSCRTRNFCRVVCRMHAAGLLAFSASTFIPVDGWR